MSIERRAGLPDKTAEKVLDILSGLRPNRSGIYFHLYGTAIFIDTPDFPETTEDDDRLIAWYEAKWRLRYVDFKETTSLDEYRADLLYRAKFAKSREFVGGIGVTFRTLEDLFYDIPNLKDRFYRTEGKVFFWEMDSAPLP